MGWSPPLPPRQAAEGEPPASSPSLPSRAVFATPLTKVQLCSTGGYSDPRKEESPGKDILQRPQRDGKAREARIPAGGEDPRKSGPLTSARGEWGGFSEGSRALHTLLGEREGRTGSGKGAGKARREQGHPVNLTDGEKQLLQPLRPPELETVTGPERGPKRRSSAGLRRLGEQPPAMCPRQGAQGAPTAHRQLEKPAPGTHSSVHCRALHHG